MNAPIQQPVQLPQPNNETLLRLQIFQKFVQDAASLFLNDMTNESGLTRTKLSEALFWGNQALMNQAQRAAQAASQQASQAVKTAVAAAPANEVPAHESKPIPAKSEHPASEKEAQHDKAANA